jgi:hypothetical protein
VVLLAGIMVTGLPCRDEYYRLTHARKLRRQVAQGEALRVRLFWTCVGASGVFAVELGLFLVWLRYDSFVQLLLLGLIPRWLLVSWVFSPGLLLLFPPFAAWLDGLRSEAGARQHFARGV